MLRLTPSLVMKALDVGSDPGPDVMKARPCSPSVLPGFREGAECGRFCADPNRNTNLDKLPVKGKNHGHAADILAASVARHLAKAERVMRDAVLEAVARVSEEPNADTIGAFAEEITAARLNAGARRSVIGAVMNALPRSPGRPGEPSAGSDPTAAGDATRRSRKARNTGPAHNRGRRNTGRDRNTHSSGSRQLQPRCPR